MSLQVSHRDLGLACLSATLLILSFPNFSLDALAWVGLVPLLVALEGKGLKDAFLLSWVTGLVFFLGICYWVWWDRAFRLLDGVLVAAYLSQYVSLWGLGLNWIQKRTGLSSALVAPALWVAMEYGRSHASFLSFPWMLLGHSQYVHPSLIQIASLTGVYGLTFLIVLMNAAIAEAICSMRQRLCAPTSSSAFQRRPLLSLAAASLLLTASYLYGVIVLSRGIEGEKVSIALVQGNVPQEQKWDKAYRQTILERYARLTQIVAEQAPQLIIWPETAVPGDLAHDPELQRKVGQVAIDTKSHLLVGSAEYAKFTNRELQGKIYNNMVLLTPEGRMAGEYRKMMPVPFAEYLPLRGVARWPTAIASRAGKVVPGEQYTLFTVEGITFGATICWENIFPDLFRQFVKRGARFMVNGTNEARFADTAFSSQLLAMSAFRAAENRVAIARSANTGISAFIDPFGRITERLRGADGRELSIEGVLVGEVLVSQEKTAYTEYGDVFAFMQIGVCGLVVLYASLRAGSRGRVMAPAQRDLGVGALRG